MKADISARHEVLRLFRDLNKLGAYEPYIKSRMGVNKNVFYTVCVNNGHGCAIRDARNESGKSWFTVVKELENAVRYYRGYKPLIFHFSLYQISFKWGDTPEGHVYWERVREKLWDLNKMK